MGEPIRLYDHMGTLYITHSPSVAAQAIAEGLLFVEPPAHTVPEVPGPVYSQTKADATAKANWLLEQEANAVEVATQTPVVPTGRARRRDRHDGGVL